MPPRQTGNSRIGNVLQLRDDFLPVILQVEGGNLVFRNHDVFHRDLFQVQDAQQHLLVFTGDGNVLVIDHRAQFLVTERAGGAVLDLDPEHPQQVVGEQVHDPHEGVGHGQQRRIDHCRRQRQFFRMQGGDGLRSQLGEDQDREDQDERGRGDPDVAVQAVTDVGRQLGDQDVDHVVAEQDQADEAVGFLEQLLRLPGPAPARAGHVAQAIAIKRHQCSFRT